MSPKDESLNLKEIAQTMVRNWKFFVVSTAISITAAWLINKFTPPTYTSGGRFLIREVNQPSIQFENNSDVDKTIIKGQKLANEKILIKSRPMAMAALDQLAFDVEYFREEFFYNPELYNDAPLKVEVDWEHPQLTQGDIRITWTSDSTYELELADKSYGFFQPKDGYSEEGAAPQLKPAKFAFNQWIEMPQLRFRVNLLQASKPGKLLIRLRDRQSLLNEYTGDKLLVESEGALASIVLLSLECSNPFKGRDYINALMQSLLERELKEKNSFFVHTINFIDGQISDVADSLNYTETNLETFRTQNRTYDITAEGNTIFEKLNELEKSLSEERFRNNYFKSILQAADQNNSSNLAVPSGLGINDNNLDLLISELMKLQSQKAQLLTSQTELSPIVTEVNQKIANLKQNIKELVSVLNRKTELTINDLIYRISRIDQQFGRLPGTEKDLISLKRKNTINENLYTFLMQKRAEAGLMLAANKPSNQVVESATLVSLPLVLTDYLRLFFGLIIGILIPILVLTGKEVFNYTVNSVKEAEQWLSVPILGKLGPNKQRTDLIAFSSPKSVLAESFRMLRNNINFTFQKDKKIIITVTSSVGDEGKSFVASNLAATFAYGKRNTLLISCDMYKWFKPENLTVGNAVGLSNYLSDENISIDSIVQPSGAEMLSVIAPGPVPPNPSELLLSARFEELLLKAKERFEVVILDTSPAGLTNETVYLTKLDDITLFVIRMNYTRKEFVSQINHLKNSDTPKIYAVLNDIGSKELPIYKYGFNYHDGNDAAKGSRKARLIGLFRRSS